MSSLLSINRLNTSKYPIFQKHTPSYYKQLKIRRQFSKRIEILDSISIHYFQGSSYNKASSKILLNLSLASSYLMKKQRNLLKQLFSHGYHKEIILLSQNIKITKRLKFLNKFSKVIKLSSPMPFQDIKESFTPFFRTQLPITYKKNISRKQLTRSHYKSVLKSIEHKYNFFNLVTFSTEFQLKLGKIDYDRRISRHNSYWNIKRMEIDFGDQVTLSIQFETFLYDLPNLQKLSLKNFQNIQGDNFGRFFLTNETINELEIHGKMKNSKNFLEAINTKISQFQVLKINCTMEYQILEDYYSGSKKEIFFPNLPYKCEYYFENNITTQITKHSKSMISHKSSKSWDIHITQEYECPLKGRYRQNSDFFDFLVITIYFGLLCFIIIGIQSYYSINISMMSDFMGQYALYYLNGNGKKLYFVIFTFGVILLGFIRIFHYSEMIQIPILLLVIFHSLLVYAVTDFTFDWMGSTKQWYLLVYGKLINFTRFLAGENLQNGRIKKRKRRKAQRGLIRQ